MKVTCFRKTQLMSLVLVLITLLCSAKAQAADRPFYIYYIIANQGVFKTRTDTGETQLVAKNNNPRGVYTRSGNSLFGWLSYNKSSIGQINLNNGDFRGFITTSVASFDVKDGFVYYSEDMYGYNKTSRIYRKATDDTQITSTFSDASPKNEIVNMIHPKYTDFRVIEDRIYFTALKSGREAWVGSKKSDGSGSVTWIAKGAITNWMLSTTTPESLYLIINIKPEETTYSTDCMVLHKITKSGGKSKALNSKYPIDINAIHSGRWAGDMYYYNNDVNATQDGQNEGGHSKYRFTYDKATGYAISMTGKRTLISQKGVVEMEKIDKNTYVFCDGAGDVYSCSISNGKISNQKKLGIKNIYYVRNLKSGGKRSTTLLSGSDGTYLLGSDMKTQKILGMEWDVIYLMDDIDGYLYSNAGDEKKLYWLSSDGKTNRALSNAAVDSVLYVEPIR